MWDVNDPAHKSFMLLLEWILYLFIIVFAGSAGNALQKFLFLKAPVITSL